ncbi:MAG: hypothetical protein EOO75_14050 [Myxococcales bacterium]|nr:MAG: hypothetical protein EOO75_14050 [Myxococcales bacterium]
MSEPYRDDLETLRRRLDTVTTDLAAVKQRLEHTHSLETEHAALEAEARELTERLARGKRRTLPLLDRVQVASPCDAEWAAMTGDAHRRHCSECDKNVYDLSSLTREQAELLLEEHEGSLCIRFYRREDGTVLTADCPVGVKRRRRRWAAFSALAAATLGGTAMMFLGAATVMMGAPPAPGPMAMGSAAPLVSGSASIEPCEAPKMGEMIEVKGDLAYDDGAAEMGRKAPPETSSRPKAPPAPTTPAIIRGR